MTLVLLPLHPVSGLLQLALNSRDRTLSNENQADGTKLHHKRSLS
ncbi:MAG TPA: hypothetical protein V6D16_17985 [Candidatus Obscuribacterales bacterium]